MGSASDETFRFLLLGKTGCGKSSTGNTILGQDLFESEVSFVSVTDECQLRSASNHGVTLEVMDCPGLFDTSKTNRQVAERVMTAFNQIPGVDVICYVMEMGGYTEEDHGAFQRLRAMLDDEGHVDSYLLPVFTHGDRLKGKVMTSVLSHAPPCLQRILQDCGQRHVVFDNTTTPADREGQVQRLVQVAREMRAQNGGRPFTCPSYMSSRLDGELMARWERVERREVDRSLWAQHLQASLGQTEHRASRQQEELSRQLQQREEDCRKQEEHLQQQVTTASHTLSQQQASSASLTSQLQQLQAQLQQDQQRRQQELQQLQSQHAAAVQQKNAEIANLR